MQAAPVISEGQNREVATARFGGQKWVVLKESLRVGLEIVLYVTKEPSRSHLIDKTRISRESEGQRGHGLKITAGQEAKTTLAAADGQRGHLGWSDDGRELAQSKHTQIREAGDGGKRVNRSSWSH